jgi:hypothetical protein
MMRPSGEVTVYLFVAPVDGRKQAASLALLVEQSLGHNVFEHQRRSPSRRTMACFHGGTNCRPIRVLRAVDPSTLGHARGAVGGWATIYARLVGRARDLSD